MSDGKLRPLYLYSLFFLNVTTNGRRYAVPFSGLLSSLFRSSEEVLFKPTMLFEGFFP